MAGGKNSARNIVLAQRRARAVELRVSGLTFRQIAARLATEYPPYDYTKAWKDVDAEMRDVAERSAEHADNARQVELQRLDAIWAELWQQRGEPRTADSLLRISERRAKLLGLDAPVRTDVTSGGEPLRVEVVYTNDPTAFTGVSQRTGED